MVVGTEAYLVSKEIVGASIIRLEDCGIETIFECEGKVLPVIVAVDSIGVTVD